MEITIKIDIEKIIEKLAKPICSNSIDIDYGDYDFDNKEVEKIVKNVYGTELDEHSLENICNEIQSKATYIHSEYSSIYVIVVDGELCYL